MDMDLDMDMDMDLDSLFLDPITVAYHSVINTHCLCDTNRTCMYI